MWVNAKMEPYRMGSSSTTQRSCSWLSSVSYDISFNSLEKKKEKSAFLKTVCHAESRNLHKNRDKSEIKILYKNFPQSDIFPLKVKWAYICLGQETLASKFQVEREEGHLIENSCILSIPT